MFPWDPKSSELPTSQPITHTPYCLAIIVDKIMAFWLPYNPFICIHNVLWHVLSYPLPCSVVYVLMLIEVRIVCLRCLWWADTLTRAETEQKWITGILPINHLNDFSYFNPCMAKSQMISCALIFIGRTRAAYKIFIRLYMLLYSLISKHLKDCYVCKWAEHLSTSFKMEVFICSECFGYYFFFFTHRSFHHPLSQN